MLSKGMSLGLCLWSSRSCWAVHWLYHLEFGDSNTAEFLELLGEINEHVKTHRIVPGTLYVLLLPERKTRTHREEGLQLEFKRSKETCVVWFYFSKRSES